MSNIGVLAFQGTVNRHVEMLQSLQVDVVKIKKEEQLIELDGLIFPAGEIMAMHRLIESFGLIEPLKNFAKSGKPIFATGAATVLMASRAVGFQNRCLSIIDLDVQPATLPNFETTLMVTDVGENVPAIFVRAPHILEVGEEVEVLSKYKNDIVAVRQGNFITCTFLPELTDDDRFHRLFLAIVEKIKRTTY